MKVVVYTLGCKVNQYESDGLIAKLEEKGHDVSTEIVPADVYILNSCAVTNEAEKKSRQTIAKFKEQNPNGRIIVCGCASQKNANQFKDIKGVSYVSGTSNKIGLVDALEKNGVFIEPLPIEYNEDYYVTPSKTRAFIKIQDGCNNFCTYCIIPYLRGRSRSRELGSILKEVDGLKNKVKEIVINGIDITDYRINGVRALDVLVDKLKDYKDIRFRLGSIEQGLIDEKFVLSIKDSNICPHFHMSLQSGCNSVLKRMNRKYTTEDFMNSVNMLRQHFNNPCITTDIIVGFPGETDEEFEKTCEFAQKIGFYNIHIFPYSSRSGTVAEKMPQVNGKIKRERAKKLAIINEELNKKYIMSCVGKTHKVLVEEFDGKYYIGHTENYIKCYISDMCKINEFVNVIIKKQYEDGALAEKE